MVIKGPDLSDAGFVYTIWVISQHLIFSILIAGPLEPGSRVWQLPYQYLRNLLLSAKVCHTNISEIYFNLPHQYLDLPTTLMCHNFTYQVIYLWLDKETKSAGNLKSGTSFSANLSGK